MVFPSSLRAQRGNPDFGAATGLPRRCAPRNDVVLRAFAPSREPNLFFSRAKTQRREGGGAFTCRGAISWNVQRTCCGGWVTICRR